MKRASLTIVSIVAVLLVSAMSAGAAVVTLVDTKDTGIASTQGGTSQSGMYGFMNADNFSGNGERRMLMQFDLSAIPAGATINSAILRIGRAAATDDTNGKAFSIYRVTSSWVEGWGSSNGSPIDSYAPAGATWTYRDLATLTPWGTLGGDKDMRTQIVCGVNNLDPTGAFKYGFYADIAAIAQTWVSGANNGLLIASDETAYQRHAMLAREAGINGGYGGDTGPGCGVKAPTLVLDYTVPEPMTMSVLALGGLGLLAKKRR